MQPMNKISLFALLITIASITGCSSDGSKNKTDHAAAEKTTPAAPAVKVTFKNDSVNAVYDHYIHLKNVLVKSDAKEAQVAAAALEKALKAIGNEKGAEAAGKIAQSTSLAAQRAELNSLTTEVENTIRPGTLSSGKIYKQYCPMANDGNGGYWLSAEPEIRNPYYGDDMLECGEVKEEIK